MFNQSAELKRIFVKALIILPLNEYEVQEKKCFVFEIKVQLWRKN